jgi:hypothetical protein
MTQKEATSVIYNSIPDAGRVDIQPIGDKVFSTFKSPLEEVYMVYYMIIATSECEVSELFNSIEEANDWIVSKINLEN